MFNKTLIRILCVQILLTTSVCMAAPLGLPQNLSDQNTKVAFEVFAPWNILDGAGYETGGNLSQAHADDLGSLQAVVSVQKLDYKAGFSPSGRIVSTWLNSNPPTPASFIFNKSSLSCSPETISAQQPCKGSVDGELTIWAKKHTIDVPIEIKQVYHGYVLEGSKEINWGDYGFGDPDSIISSLKPLIKLNFTVELPPNK